VGAGCIRGQPFDDPEGLFDAAPTREVAAGLAGAAPDVPVLQGFLKKEGRTRGSWKRRWCALRLSGLAYSKQRESSKPQGVVDTLAITGVSLPSSSEGYGENVFCIHTVGSGKVGSSTPGGSDRRFVLQAPSAEAQHHWMHAIAAVARFLRGGKPETFEEVAKEKHSARVRAQVAEMERRATEEEAARKRAHDDAVKARLAELEEEAARKEREALRQAQKEAARRDVERSQARSDKAKHDRLLDTIPEATLETSGSVAQAAAIARSRAESPLGDSFISPPPLPAKNKAPEEERPMELRRKLAEAASKLPPRERRDVEKLLARLSDAQLELGAQELLSKMKHRARAAARQRGSGIASNGEHSAEEYDPAKHSLEAPVPSKAPKHNLEAPVPSKAPKHTEASRPPVKPGPSRIPRGRRGSTASSQHSDKSDPRKPAVPRFKKPSSSQNGREGHSALDSHHPPIPSVGGKEHEHRRTGPPSVASSRSSRGSKKRSEWDDIFSSPQHRVKPLPPATSLPRRVVPPHAIFPSGRDRAPVEGYSAKQLSEHMVGAGRRAAAVRWINALGLGEPVNGAAELTSGARLTAVAIALHPKLRLRGAFSAPRSAAEAEANAALIVEVLRKGGHVGGPLQPEPPTPAQVTRDLNPNHAAEAVMRLAACAFEAWCVDRARSNASRVLQWADGILCRFRTKLSSATDYLVGPWFARRVRLSPRAHPLPVEYGGGAWPRWTGLHDELSDGTLLLLLASWFLGVNPELPDGVEEGARFESVDGIKALGVPLRLAYSAPVTTQHRQQNLRIALNALRAANVQVLYDTESFESAEEDDDMALAQLFAARRVLKTLPCRLHRMPPPDGPLPSVETVEGWVDEVRSGGEEVPMGAVVTMVQSPKPGATKPLVVVASATFADGTLLDDEEYDDVEDEAGDDTASVSRSVASKATAFSGSSLGSIELFASDKPVVVSLEPRVPALPSAAAPEQPDVFELSRAQGRQLVAYALKSLRDKGRDISNPHVCGASLEWARKKLRSWAETNGFPPSKLFLDTVSSVEEAFGDAKALEAALQGSTGVSSPPKPVTETVPPKPRAASPRPPPPRAPRPHPQAETFCMAEEEARSWALARMRALRAGHAGFRIPTVPLVVGSIAAVHAASDAAANDMTRTQASVLGAQAAAAAEQEEWAAAEDVVGDSVSAFEEQGEAGESAPQDPPPKRVTVPLEAAPAPASQHSSPARPAPKAPATHPLALPIVLQLRLPSGWRAAEVRVAPVDASGPRPVIVAPSAEVSAAILALHQRLDAAKEAVQSLSVCWRLGSAGMPPEAVPGETDEGRRVVGTPVHGFVQLSHLLGPPTPPNWELRLAAKHITDARNMGGAPRVWFDGPGSDLWGAALAELLKASGLA
jgi:hypothetical protein